MFVCRNSCAETWSPFKGNRFKHAQIKNKEQAPAPGTYNPTDVVDGNYILSQTKTGGFTKFMPAHYPMSRQYMNQLKKSSETPGPGHYPHQSDFVAQTPTLVRR